ncbi:MAG TPA: cyclic nucleotide-binding domain-containing protein [Candidatus Nitrosotalea sp.]|nr:cyclic nucleotide-binding domain-containing protein [Candidatus Nitrosotalea sp.]
MAASKPIGPSPMGAQWSAILRGDRVAANAPRLLRRLFALVPGRPRCKFCNAPYGGPLTLPFRIMGYRPSDKTPHVCLRCLEWAPEGGAIVPISILFADVRNYTNLTQSSQGEVPALLNRFYGVASRVLLRHEGVLGQIAGDQVMGLFVPGLSGRDYPRKAVAAAAALLEAVGYRTPAGPWIQIGIGISTGEEFCGNVGGGGFKDFTAVGEVTNTAAGLTSRAVAGEVLVDEATHAAAPEFSFAGGDTVMLKGTGQPVDTHRLAVEVPADAGEEPLAVLLRTPVFSGLPAKLSASLRSRVHRRAFAAGAYLAREGEPATSMFVIERGLVRETHTSRHGRELVLRLLGAGDTFGELGVLDAAGIRTASAIAVEPTSCVMLSKDDLHAALLSTPQLGLRMLASLVASVRRKDEELADFAFLDVTGRIARKLLDLADRHGEAVTGGVRIGIRLPQAELAAMVGASRENVNRSLGQLVTLGALAMDGGHITILDADRLKSMC